MHDFAGIKGFKEISARIGRSINAIKLYRHRHKLPLFFNNNFYSYTLLSDELGKSRSRLREYHKRGWLKGKRASWSGKFGARPMMFLEDDIVEFLKQHHNLFSPKRIQNIYFRNIVKNLQES